MHWKRESPNLDSTFGAQPFCVKFDCKYALNISITTRWPQCSFSKMSYCAGEPASRFDLPKYNNNTFSSDFLCQNQNYAAETVADAAWTHKNTSDYACKTHCGPRRKLHIMLQKPAADRQTVITILKFFKRKFKGKSQSPKTKNTSPETCSKTGFRRQSRKKYDFEAFQRDKNERCQKKEKSPQTCSKTGFRRQGR